MWAAVLLRLIFPLIIFKYPFGGAVAVIAFDLLDMDLIKRFNGNLDNYQTLDKTLDTYYLAIEAIIVLTWKNKLVKKIALGLFIYRLLGFSIFLFTQNLLFLVIFPNVFEYFYLIYLGIQKIFKKDLKSKMALAVILIILIMVKVTHEYWLHFY